MTRIVAGGKSIECNVAKTEIQKIKGLMFEKKIKPLLFVFSKEKKYVFHTCFMRAPIEIVWLDKQKKIIGKKTAVPWKIYIVPKKPAKYVLEIPVRMGKYFKEGKKVKF